jgi:adenylate cyclase
MQHMAEKRTQRRLAAILAADVVGYSRMMEQDEAGTLAALKSRLTDVIQPLVAEHQGSVFKSTGDGLLIEFGSAVNAVECAVELQRKMASANQGFTGESAIVMRIGVNLGDVMVDGSDLFGDGINIAARLEGLAEPGGILVSGTAYDHVRNKVKVGFEDLGAQAVKNIAEPVRTYRVQLGAVTARIHPTLALPDKPSIAVLPFQNMSGDPEQEYFADGIVEEITAALSRVRSLFVIARNSTSVYKSRSATVQQIGRELGVHYLIEGSVRMAADRVRIVAQLIEAGTGNQLWASRYEGARSDIFDLQDRITESVVGAIQPSILTTEIERSRRKRPQSLVAYDYVLRAFPLVWSFNKAKNEAARAMLDRAISIDPTYPLALSLSAWCHAQCAVYNWTDAPALARDEALRLAQQAATISCDDPMVLAILGAAHTIASDFDIAAAHLERAVALDPNSAWAWHRSGWLNIHRERPEVAIEQFEHAIRLSPFDPMDFVCLFGIGVAHFVAGRYDQAIAWTQKGLSQQPEAYWAYRVLVPALVHAGRKEDAKCAATILMKSFPGLTISKVRRALVYGPRTMDRIIEGLGEAGLPV